MLPYPHTDHFWISQEPAHPNPTNFTMAPVAHLDQQHPHYDHCFFPGHGQLNSETLEAVLRPRPAAPQAASLAVAAAAAQDSRKGSVASAGHVRPRKRPFRTDRHSKIRTAQGIRDRRMRLSLDVARNFFGLQDQLGFDKASKTVDWLLTQSKPAIDRLYESSRVNDGGKAGMPLQNHTRHGVRRLQEAAEAGQSQKRGLYAEKERARSGGSVLMEHSSELNGGDGFIPGATVGEYYYDLGEMMSRNGGEGDDDGAEGEYEEDDDFLDGMQY